MKPQSKKLIKKISAIVKRQGRVGLLPHNLPDEILKGVGNSEDEDFPSLMVYFTIVFMAGKKGIVEADDEKLHENANSILYFMGLEELRRAGLIEYKPFPTVQNIFTLKEVSCMLIKEHPLYKEFEEAHQK